MRKAAADRATIADCGMRDMRHRLGQQWRVRCDIRRFQEIDMPGQRADHQRVAAHRDAAQLAEFADIDDQFRRKQAQIHRRHQALAA
jgi:hypothetical protein